MLAVSAATWTRPTETATAAETVPTPPRRRLVLRGLVEAWWWWLLLLPLVVAGIRPRGRRRRCRRPLRRCRRFGYLHRRHRHRRHRWSCRDCPGHDLHLIVHWDDSRHDYRRHHHHPPSRGSRGNAAVKLRGGRLPLRSMSPLPTPASQSSWHPVMTVAITILRPLQLLLLLLALRLRLNTLLLLLRALLQLAPLQQLSSGAAVVLPPPIVLQATRTRRTTATALPSRGLPQLQPRGAQCPPRRHQ